MNEACVTRRDRKEGSGSVSTLRSETLPGPTGPKDVNGRVGVRVGLVPTRLTSEHSPTPVPNRDVPTRCTLPAGVAGVHGHDVPTGALSLVGGHGQEVSPPGVENGSVEPCFGFGPVRFVAPCSIGTRLGSPGHVLDLEILKDDEVVVGHQSPGDLVGEVAPLVANLAVLGRHPFSGLLPTPEPRVLVTSSRWAAARAAWRRRAKRALSTSRPSLVASTAPTPRSIPTI